MAYNIVHTYRHPSIHTSIYIHIHLFIFLFLKIFSFYLFSIILGDFRKLKVERADTTDNIEKNGGFLTPTKFEHHNFTAMEKFVYYF